MKADLLNRIITQRATLAVIGLGYVGLPLAVAFAERGFQVFGVDVDPERVHHIQEGESYVQDISSQRLAKVSLGHDGAGPRLTAASGYESIARCDVAIIAVPTPLVKTRDPDLRYVIRAGEGVAEYAHDGMLVILESTTYPGTTNDLLLPLLQKALADGRPSHSPPIVGQDYFLAFSPERIDPGQQQWTVENTAKVVGGVTPACLEIATALYRQIVDQVVPVSSTQTAEMTKLLENTFRAVNIALVNEVAIMCDKLGIDPWEVIEAAATKPYGFMKFTPGPGVGGHCIPLDPYYLSWKLRTLNYNARFIQLSGEINADMPLFWVNKTQDALNEAGKAVKRSQILILGVAYKKNVDDLRESPALDIITLLEQKGAHIQYHDPYVSQFDHQGILRTTVPDWRSAVQESDCVVVVTDHSFYDWPWLAAHALALVDTRNATGGRRLTTTEV
jgi:UDP-N-acetyl-D-glucosamine dehydrogenase